MKKSKRLLGILLCCALLLGLMSISVFAKDGKLDHIDVRVAGKLTITSKVNGEVISSEDINVTVSNVSAVLNGEEKSFYRKTGTGDENEWRCDHLDLDPSKDVVVLTCTVNGKKSDGTAINNLVVTKTYQGSDVLNAFIRECPGKSGYDIDLKAEDITETFTVDKTVTKVWVGDDEATRPESIQVQLYADGQSYGNPVTLNSANSWRVTYENLPKYSSGDTEIQYTVDEVNVPAGYSKSVEGLTITNTYVITSVTVIKEWDDNENQDGIRPGSVIVALLADGEKTGDTVTLNSENKWTATFGDLSKFNDDGGEITYSVKEETVEGYAPEYAKDGRRIKITNKHTPETVSVPVQKIWQDEDNQDSIRPSEITVQLLANGEAVQGQTLTLNDDNQWTGSFADLPAYQNGQRIVYTVEEEEVEGYSAVISGNAEDGFVITNSHTPTEPTEPEPTEPEPTQPDPTEPADPTEPSKPAETNPDTETTEKPKTGDSASLLLWTVLLLISCCGLIGTAAYRRMGK